MNLRDLSIIQIKEYLAQASQELTDDRFSVIKNIIEHLEKDDRKGTQSLIKSANRIIKAYDHWQKMMVYEHELIGEGYQSIAGVDEVGRGPLAGPVVSASVILNRNVFIPGINDSKKLSKSQRESLYEKIQQNAVAIGISIINADIIDRINILRASLEAMCQAVDKLPAQPDFLLVDGQHCPNINLPMKSIIGGDGLSLSIASASIIAKVTRDRIMDDLDKNYPQYNFSKNKGYPTPDHLSALEKFGPCEIHRKSFAPVAQKLRQLEITF